MHITFAYNEPNSMVAPAIPRHLCVHVHGIYTWDDDSIMSYVHVVGNKCPYDQGDA